MKSASPFCIEPLQLCEGGFWFDDDEALHDVAGPKARLEWRIDDVIGDWAGSRLTIEGEYSHDDVRDDRWEVGARLRIPFGRDGSRYAMLDPQERRMTEGLERDTDIVTAQSKEEPVQDAATNVRFDRVAYVDDGGSVTDTSAAAGANTLIIADGTIVGPQELQGDQTLQGGGARRDPRRRLRQLQQSRHLRRQRPRHRGDRTDRIADTGSIGINFQNGNRNVSIADTIVTGTGYRGIVFGDNSRDVTIASTRVSDTGAYGIMFWEDSRNMTIVDTTVTNTGSSGIHILRNNTVTIANTTLKDTGCRHEHHGYE